MVTVFKDECSYEVEKKRKRRLKLTVPANECRKGNESNYIIIIIVGLLNGLEFVEI